MQTRVKIAANTMAQFAGRGITATSAFVVTILIARHFGVEAYGDFVKITTFVAFFYLLADFGLNAVVVKELGIEQNGNTNKLQSLKTLFTARILLGIGLTWIAVMLTVFLPYSPATKEGFGRLTKLGIIIFAPTILLQALIRSTNAYFQFRLRYDQATIAIISGSLTSLFLIGGIVFLNISSVLFIVAALLIAAATHGAAAIFLFGRLINASWRPSLNLSLIVSLLRKSFPLGLTLVLNIAFFRLDTFLLAIFRPTTEVGLYGLAYKFFEFPLALPTFFMNAVYPLLSKLKPRESSADATKFRRIIKKSALFLFVSSIVSTTTLWLLAPHIALIKDDFAGSVNLFRLLVLWLPLFFLSSLLMWIVIVEQRHWALTLIYTAGLMLNAVLNLLLVPSHGATAAALTTGATELFILISLFFSVKISPEKRH